MEDDDDDRDEELLSDDDEELDSSDEDDEDDEDAELDDISETELEEMAASTQRSLFMVQMQLANQRAAEEEAQRNAGIMEIEEEEEEQANVNPLDRWQDFVDAIARSKVFKVTDADCKDIIIKNIAANHLHPMQVVSDLMATITSPQASGFTHIMVGGEFLNVIKDQQRNLFQALWARHCSTLTYLKIGTNTTSKGLPPVAQGILDVESLFTILKMPPPPLQLQPQQPFVQPLPSPSSQFNHSGANSSLLLTEMELCHITITSSDQIVSMVEVLNCATSLKQLNLLGLEVGCDTLYQHQRQQQYQQGGLILDPILAAVAELPQVDECRISCRAPSSIPLISSSCLAQVLAVKPKWWRLGLDGVGLEDQHCQVLAQAMSHEYCKAGDLLSLTMNPAVSSLGWHQIFDVLFQKQRMGLVKVDDKSWQATFDLVRSMNNIHGRLNFLESGTYTSRERWIEWLAKLSQISWEDEAHKANYLWFTILERPDFVHC
ncbi:hypothetical protein ACA910_005080 [Epithemia clementina (nom. ined.)]